MASYMTFTTLTKRLESLDQTLFLFATLGILLGLYLTNQLQTIRGLPLPPGPRRLPLLGNLFDLPSFRPWLTYNRWAATYGEVIYMQLPFQPVILLNSTRAALDLMEKRSSIYSDKMFTTLDEMTGWNWNFSILPYGPRWRDRRRAFHQYFNQNVVSDYHGIQIREVRGFLKRLLADNFSVESTRLTTASIIVKVVYGRQVESLDDDYIKLATDAFDIIMAAKKPGAFFVDFMPFIRHIPSWLPGTASRRFAEQHRPTIERLRDEAFYDAKKLFNGGTYRPSIVQSMLEELQAKGSGSSSAVYSQNEEVARDASSAAFIAAVDTSLIGSLFFVLAMGMHPEVQKKAQAQLDEVLGSSRLPTFEDYNSLPYIQAIILEVLRWMPPAPLGLPHSVLKDDEYNGFLIPKGSLIVPNIWAMLHDPDVYPQPDAFNPDRFIHDGVLNKDVMDPSTVVFGFGRRICPGRFIGKDTLFITIASILSVFDIVPATDAHGEPVILRAEPTSGVLSYPESVPCVFRPRSAACEQLINESM